MCCSLGLYYKEADDKQKIQVFMPECAKAYSPLCKVIYADGTYKCLQPFTQLYVMSEEGEDGVSVPIMYALMDGLLIWKYRIINLLNT